MLAVRPMPHLLKLQNYGRELSSEVICTDRQGPNRLAAGVTMCSFRMNKYAVDRLRQGF